MKERLIFALIGGLAVGCASQPEVAPEQRALAAVAEDFADGVEEAREQANERPSYIFDVRYNPAQCPCPDFEVRAFGTWERVFIDGDLDEVQRMARVAENSTSLQTFRLQGRISTTTRRTEARVEFPVFEVLEL